MTQKLRTSLTIDDLMTGILANLSLKRINKLWNYKDKIDGAMEKSYLLAKELSAQEGLTLNFKIMRHPIHGYSKTVDGGVYSAVQRGLLSRECPRDEVLNLRLSQEEAELFLEHLPGSKEFYQQVTEEFWRSYQ